jgi:hypothetical protein
LPVSATRHKASRFPLIEQCGKVAGLSLARRILQSQSSCGESRGRSAQMRGALGESRIDGAQMQAPSGDRANRPAA